MVSNRVLFEDAQEIEEPLIAHPPKAASVASSAVPAKVQL
jgi:hypothetical protein